MKMLKRRKRTKRQMNEITPFTPSIFRLLALVYFVLVFLIFSRCSDGVESTEPVIPINVKNVVETYDMTHIIDSTILIIPLETNNNCLIGKIDKLEIKGERIYISDNLAKSIFIFDMTGKFIHKIDAFGKGPDEYLTISSMTVWGSYTHVRKIMVIKKTFDLDLKAFNVGEIDIPLEKLVHPYFFVITPNLMCHSFFAVTKENPALTMKYLSTMKTKLMVNH